MNGSHALRDLAGYYDEHEFLTELIRTLEAMNLDNKVYHALTEGAEFDDLDSSRTDAGDVSDFITRIKTELSALPAVLVKDSDSSIIITGIDRGNGPVDYDTRIRLTKVEDPEFVRIEETGDTVEIGQLARYLSDELGISITTVNSALGSEDDRQDLASTVTVPDDFPEDKLVDLISWVQSELANENYDLDISQKIYFFTKVFTRTPYKDIKEYFAEGIENALKENELYESQNKKPYLLNINVLDSNGSWIYPKKWSENVKEKVNDLLDEDFITFWEIYRIIRINYGSCKDNLYTDIKSIVVIHGMYGQEVYREEDKSYKEIIDLFNERLLSIAEKEDWKIYKVVDAKTQKKYI